MQALDVWGHLNCYMHILVRLHHKSTGFPGTYEEVMPH